MEQEVKKVRDLTTADSEWLPDTKIQEYLTDYQDREAEVRVLLAAAKCCEYMCRDDVWDSERTGNETVTKNVLPERATNFRRRAAATEMVLA
jgi:hypothetical protein